MVPVGNNKSKVDEVGSVDVLSKRPTPYSLPPKTNWMAILNGGGQNISQKLLRPVDLRVTSNSSSQSQAVVSPTSSESPVTPVRAFPVPLPRTSSCSSSDSGPKTPVPLPRTKFNLPAIDPTTSLERSASFPETAPAERSVKPQLSHSISCPNSNDDKPHPKVDKNKTVDSALSTVPESSVTILSIPLEEEDDIDTWL
ncbi:hypothetical protein DAPPUDRAFT_326978 [Daphnia pulex]|uniref:Uncharacterized protein n=1 Tax=Daphnia pulex TaxID=6669 RepID=E9H9C1_DAPPU|nr:hypothetical protein DAPPUDRAFT_326978 [Daphnia pulex]|eukprot:EFX71681.1 hypothetical protein DAPPUDRAFT_326978 [Daphnia pulex]